LFAVTTRAIPLPSIVGAICLGFVPGIADSKLKPNEGISIAWKYLALAVVGGISLLVFAIGQWDTPIPGMEHIASVMVPVIMFVFTMRFGGQTILRHYSLRALLKFSGLLPWRLVEMLEQARELILLSRVGGSYTFVHGLLQEHFAKRQIGKK
jgi:hypothetical protein